MFEQLVGKLPVGIAVINEDFRIVYMNDFFLDRLPHDLRSSYQENVVTDLFQEQGKFLKRRLKSVFVLQHPSFSYWEQRPHIFPFKSSRPITGEETQMYQNMEIIPIKDPLTKSNLACIFLQDVTAQASYFRTQQKLSEALKKEHYAQKKLIKKLDTAKAVSLARSGFTPMISAAMSISRMAIHLRPEAPRVMFRATTAQTIVKNRQNIYAAHGWVCGPVRMIPTRSRSGALIWPEAE